MKRIILMLLTGLVTTVYADVVFERLVNAAEEPQNWLTYSGSYRSERYSRLTQINKNNVADLKVIWAYQMQPPTIGGAGLSKLHRLWSTARCILPSHRVP